MAIDDIENNDFTGSGVPTLPGKPAQVEIFPKETLVESARRAGFSDQEIVEWADTQRPTWKEAGFEDEDINQYLGFHKPAPESFLQRLANTGEVSPAAVKSAGEMLSSVSKALKFDADWERGTVKAYEEGKQLIKKGLTDITENRPVSGLSNLIFGGISAGLAPAFGLSSVTEEQATKLSGDPVFGKKVGVIADVFMGQPERTLAAAGVALHGAQPIARAGQAADEVIGGLPTAQTFTDAARVISSGDVPPVLRQKLVELYEQGHHPAEVAIDALSDAKLREELLSLKPTAIPEKYRPSNQFTQQDDLFGRQPEQGSFRFMEPGKNEMGFRDIDIIPEGMRGPYDENAIGAHEFSWNGKKGVIYLSSPDDGRNLIVDWIGNGQSAWNSPPGDFGTVAMRQLLDQIKHRYPDAVTLNGERITGARMATDNVEDVSILLRNPATEKYLPDENGVYRNQKGQMRSTEVEPVAREDMEWGLNKGRKNEQPIYKRMIDDDTTKRQQDSFDLDTGYQPSLGLGAGDGIAPKKPTTVEELAAWRNENPKAEPPVKVSDIDPDLPSFVHKPKDEAGPIRSWFGKIYRNFIDDINPIKDVDTRAYEKARNVRGTHGLIEEVIDGTGPRDFNTLQSRGPSLRAILEPVGEDLAAFNAYREARQQVSLADEGLAAVNDTTRASVEANAARFAEIEKQIEQFQTQVLMFARDAGIMTAKTFERKLATQHLASVDQIIKDTFAYLTAARRNEAKLALIDALIAKGKGFETATPLVREIAESSGKSVSEVNDIIRQLAKEDPTGRISAMRDGKRVTVEVTDPELLKAARMMDHDSLNMLMKIIAAPARGLRAGATLTPEFMAKNLVRDFMQAFVATKGVIYHPINTFKGAKSIITKDEAFQMWRSGGGSNATLVHLDHNYLQEALRHPAGLNGLTRRAANVVLHPWESLRMVSELAENATRVGEFKKLIDKGGVISKEAIEQAAFASREVTLDFARVGASMRGWNSISAFLNATIQGSDRLARAFKDNPFATSTRIGAGIVAPSALLWWRNHDDPRYQALPQWDKDLYWHILTADRIYRIPKPFETGVLFGTGTERFLEWYFRDNPRAFKGFHEAVIGAIVPQALPTIAAAIEDQRANRSSLTGKPLMSTMMAKGLPEEQYTPYTTELAKWVGQHVANIPGVRAASLQEGSVGFAAAAVSSPLLIENYIRSWTGGMGMYGVQLLDKGLRTMGILPDPVKPTQNWDEMPFFRAFVSKQPSSQTSAIETFLSEQAQYERIFMTWNNLAKSGGPDAKRAEENIREFGGPAMFTRLTSLKETFNQQAKMVKDIHKHPSMSGDDKRRIIDQLYTAMDNVAQAGVKALDEVNKRK